MVNQIKYSSYYAGPLVAYVPVEPIKTELTRKKRKVEAIGSSPGLENKTKKASIDLYI